MTKKRNAPMSGKHHTPYAKMRITISVLRSYGHDTASIAKRVGLSEQVVSRILNTREERNRKKRTEYHRQWRKRNPEKVKAIKKRYYERLREMGKESARSKKEGKNKK